MDRNIIPSFEHAIFYILEPSLSRGMEFGQWCMFKDSVMHVKRFKFFILAPAISDRLVDARAKFISNSCENNVHVWCKLSKVHVGYKWLCAFILPYEKWNFRFSSFSFILADFALSHMFDVHYGFSLRTPVLKAAFADNWEMIFDCSFIVSWLWRVR